MRQHRVEAVCNVVRDFVLHKPLQQCIRYRFMFHLHNNVKDNMSNLNTVALTELLHNTLQLKGQCCCQQHCDTRVKIRVVVDNYKNVSKCERTWALNSKRLK